jgi:hypothetical protein
MSAIDRWKRISRERIRDFSRRLEGFSGRLGIWNITDHNQQVGFASRGAWHERLRFKRLYLESENTKRSFRFVTSFKLESELIRERERLGLVVLNGSEGTSRLKSQILRIPRFVSLVVDLPDTIEEYFNNLPTNRRRQVRQAIDRGYRVEYTRDSIFCREFIQAYNLPTVQNSHGDEGITTKETELIKLLQESDTEIMKVLKGDKCILAGICINEGHAYRLYKVGWLNGDTRWVKEGAHTFHIWQAIIRARELGLSKLDLGGTPPFLDDGVFNYKMRWNARLNTKRRTLGEHCLLMNPGHPAVQSFFQRHSMIVYDSVNRICFCSGHRPSNLKLCKGILDGISGWWRLVSPQEAKDRGLDKEPSNGMPSGWFVPEPFDDL